MESIIEILTKEDEVYLDTNFVGLKKNIDFYHISFTKGETDLSRLLVVQKSNLNLKEGMMILTMRLLMLEEEWTDYLNYSKEDLKRWTGLLRTNYNNSIFIDDIDLNDDSDKFVFERLKARNISFIEKNNVKIDFVEFEKIIYSLKNSILRISKSKFNRLEIEFYIETIDYYILFNWYTTA